jgi:NTE family protein
MLSGEKIKARMSQRSKIGLALGVGGARAFSPVGGFAGLMKHGVSIDIVTGTGMGAIIRAMYATNADVSEIKTLRNLHWR